jgi:signal recognition particle subunit SRP54
VSLPIVRQFVKSVEEKALGVKVLKGIRPDQQLVKVVNDQLVELMGGQQEDLNDPKDGPQVCPGEYWLYGTSQTCSASPHH